MSGEASRLLDGLEEMLKGWQLSAGAMSALAGQQIPEGAEELTAELLLLQVAEARDELHSLEVEALDAQQNAEELAALAAAGPKPAAVPQGRRQ